MNLEKDLYRVRQLASRLGVSETKIIKAEDIVVSDWVRLKCHYGCSSYGKTLTCPPFSPNPDEFRRILKGYDWALLLKFDTIEPQRDWKDPHDIVAKLERSVFLEGYHSAFGLACGPCPYCDECNLKNCVNPDSARPSMEACGIDVYSTARKAGFKLEVVKDEGQKPTYFGLLLVK